MPNVVKEAVGHMLLVIGTTMIAYETVQLLKALHNAIDKKVLTK